MQVQCRGSVFVGATKLRLRLRSVFSSPWVFLIAGAVRPAVPTGGPPYPHAPYGAGRGNYDAFRGQGYPGKPRNRMVRGDPRAIVEYRDLDAPDDVDFF